MLRLEFRGLNEHRFRHNLSVSVQYVLAILELKIMRISSCIALGVSYASYLGQLTSLQVRFGENKVENFNFLE